MVVDNVTVASYSHTPSTLTSPFICPSSSATPCHNIEQNTSVRLACFTQCLIVGLTAAAQVSVSEFLKKHETVFEVVDPRLSLLRLIRKGVIAEDAKSCIDSSNTNDACEVLYHHLAHHANVDTLKDYCEVAIDVTWEEDKEELQQGGWSELCAYVRLCMCVCVCCSVCGGVWHL